MNIHVEPWGMMRWRNKHNTSTLVYRSTRLWQPAFSALSRNNLFTAGHLLGVRAGRESTGRRRIQPQPMPGDWRWAGARPTWHEHARAVRPCVVYAHRCVDRPGVPHERTRREALARALHRHAVGRREYVYVRDTYTAAPAPTPPTPLPVPCMQPPPKVMAPATPGDCSCAEHTLFHKSQVQHFHLYLIIIID